MGKYFNLKTILLWTINDFPAYGNLSGCCTHREFACPLCGFDHTSKRLKNSSKTVYLGHQRFLDPKHPFRRNMKDFDGKVEKHNLPKVWDGHEMLREM